MRSGGDI